MDIETTKPAPKTAPSAVKKAVEIWATEKKMLPRRAPGRELRPAEPIGHQVDTLTVAGLGTALRAAAPARNPLSWKFDAARVGNKWPNGMELTEAEFDAAIAALDNPI